MAAATGSVARPRIPIHGHRGCTVCGPVDAAAVVVVVDVVIIGLIARRWTQ